MRKPDTNQQSQQNSDRKIRAKNSSTKNSKTGSGRFIRPSKGLVEDFHKIVTDVFTDDIYEFSEGWRARWCTWHVNMVAK